MPDSDASALDRLREVSAPALGRGDGGRGGRVGPAPGGPGTEREERQTQGELGDAECRDCARGPQGAWTATQAKQTRLHPRGRATAAKGMKVYAASPWEAGKHCEEAD